jgi:ribose transport system ATP-binding protein
MPDPLLLMSGVVKAFPGVRALDGVDLDVRAGEVHCLLGQNGAGKSTLIKVLAGAHTPDEGTITWNGGAARLTSPMAAMQLGVATIYQELDLVDGLTVAENVFLGPRAQQRRLRQGRRGPCGDRRAAAPARPPGDLPEPRGRAGCPRPASRSSAWPRRCRTTHGSSSWTSPPRCSTAVRSTSCSPSSAS